MATHQQLQDLANEIYKDVFVLSTENRAYIVSSSTKIIVKKSYKYNSRSEAIDGMYRKLMAQKRNLKLFSEVHA